MESQIATHQDADIILRLYDLRREAVLRQARNWMAMEFSPKTAEEFMGVVSGPNSQENAYLRQVTTYWEMAASLVLHGTVNSDLFLDSNGEGIYIFAKYYAFREAYQAKMGRPFMRQTAQLIEKYPAARERFQTVLKSIQGRAS